MKGIARSTLVVLLASMVVSCATRAPASPAATPTPTQPSATPTTPRTVEGTIHPGDELQGMVFAPIDEMDWDISLVFLCDFESMEETGTSRTVPCFASPGSRVFFGNCWGIAYDSPQEADKRWEEIRIDVTFDGQGFHAPSFGYLDIAPSEPGEEYIRIWNLMVEHVSPGTHTIVCEWEDEDGSGATIYDLTVSDQAEPLSTLSAKPTPRLQFYTSEETGLDYVLYAPDSYGTNPQEKWPLLLYLHGMDRVNGSVYVLRNDYPLDGLDDQDDFPFVVVAPQGTGEYEFWATDQMVAAIMTLLDEIQRVLAVDANRVYLTGVSAGGNGTWSIGVRHPERFAAMVPVMGYYGRPPTVPEKICDLAGIPVWAFHGAKDEVIPLDAEQKLVDALEACGGDVQFTVFPDAGHGLDARRVYTPELYSWLLSQTQD